MDHDDHLEGEKNAKMQKTTRGIRFEKGTSSSTQKEIDDDESIYEEVSLEFLAGLVYLGKTRVLTIVESQRMKEMLENMMHERCKNAKEVKYKETHGQDFMDEIMVNRADKRAYIFLESDYKYMNRNNIEYMYLSCLKREVDHKNGLLNSLIVFFRSCVIWERVHDYQLGIESYQIKINLTAPTLVISGIKALKPYTSISDPFIGIVYENKKKERRVMNINELPKFCDATLNKVLKKVEEILLTACRGFKEPPLTEEHK
uniref:Uncharacterized protein n=1 Tax=Tanacetum cinerariifolium TaxID=118510 RepID=A0A699GHZ7_TANCI|nr:hypothetical protein [Tanacetum cinerariifolium]